MSHLFTDLFPSLVPEEYSQPSLPIDTDSEGQLYLVILYKELDHPGILLSVRVFDTEILVMAVQGTQ